MNSTSNALVALAHPGLLWLGAGLITVPIIIHFLFRRKHRVVRWAAMDFLLAALKKQKRRVQMENLILLLMRCLMIGLLALACARPALRSAAFSPLGGGARGVVLVLDTSTSMGARATGRRHLDRARERARELIQDLPEGSEVTLVVTRDDLNGGGPAALVEGATPTRARDRVDRQLQLSYGPNDLAEVMRFARNKLATVRGRKSIVFVTDQQERDWRNADGKRSEDLYRSLRALTEREEGAAVPVTVLGIGLGNRDNVTVRSLATQEGREAFAGETVGLSAELVNFGRAPASGTLTLFTSYADDAGWERRDPVQTVTIPPSLAAGEPRVELIDLFVPLARDRFGPTRFKVVFRPDQGPSDRLPDDNERSLALTVREPTRILPVRSFRGAMELLKDVEVVPILEYLSPVFPEELAVTDLARVDLIVWADADFLELDEAGAKKLRDFVARGGGLLAYLGEYARPANRINEFFFAENGEGLFPMLLADGPARRVEDGGDPWRIDVAAADRDGKGHILFRELTTLPGNVSPAILSFRAVTEAPPEQIVARYDDEEQSAAVLEHRYGLGRVVVATTTPDERGFRMDGSLLPPLFFFNAVHHLISEDARRRNVQVGETVAIPLREGAQRVSIELPDGAGGTVEEPVTPDQTRFVFAATTQPGFYNVTVRANPAARAVAEDRAHLIAVNLDPSESDLRPARAQALRELYPRTTLEFVGSIEELEPDAGVGDDGEVSRGLLASVIGLLFAELFLAWRFGNRRRRTG